MRSIEEKAQKVLNDLYHKDTIDMKELNTLVSYIDYLKHEVDECMNKYKKEKKNEKDN